MADTARLYTEDDLLRVPKDGRKYELVKGELRVSPAGLRHEKIAVKLGQLLLNFVERHRLGDVYGSSAGFKLPNGDIRSPDVSFVRADRLPDGQAPEGFAEFLPDLAVEIVSPTDRATEIAEKIGEYLAHGVQVVWLVEPRHQTITVYHSMTDVMTFHATEELRGDPVLPGFSCRVQQVFV
jgi:Uma2 family endonuclease